MRLRTTLTLLLASALLVAIAYGNTLHNGFHFDDGHSIEDNAYLRSFAHVPRYFVDVSTFSPLAENRSYRPLLLVSFALSYALGGGAPWAFHVVTLLLHALGAFVVGLLAWRFFRSSFAAFFAAAAFAVHPLVSEPVNYISARSSLMGAVLLFATVLLYVRAREDGRRRGLVLANIVLVLALGTKLLAITVPALLLAWEYLLGPDRDRLRDVSLRSWCARLLPPTVIAFGFAVLHETLVGATARGARSSITPWSHLLTQTRVWQRYQALFLWPEDLCADLVMRWSEVPWEGETARAILWTIFLVVVAWVSRRRMPVFAFAVVWFYVTLSPTNSFVPLAEPATEHRVYVALPGLIWAALAILSRALGARTEDPVVRRAVWFGGAIVVGALILTAVQRNRVWRDEGTLWSDVIACAPTNGRAHLNYGRFLFATKDYEGARRSYEACAAHWPSYVFCYINLVVVDLEQDEHVLAERHIAVAERISPNNVYTNIWRGEVELAAGRYDTAEGAFTRALAIAPGFPEAERGLAEARFELGRVADAEPLLARLAPMRELDATGWFAYGFIAEKKGDLAAAKQRYAYAVALDPKDARARYNLARLLHAEGAVDDALAHYARLYQDGAASPDALFNYALALASRGRIADARAVRERLRATAPHHPRLPELTF